MGGVYVEVKEIREITENLSEYPVSEEVLTRVLRNSKY